MKLEAGDRTHRGRRLGARHSGDLGSLRNSVASCRADLFVSLSGRRRCGGKVSRLFSMPDEQRSVRREMERKGKTKSLNLGTQSILGPAHGPPRTVVELGSVHRPPKLGVDRGRSDSSFLHLP